MRKHYALGAITLFVSQSELNAMFTPKKINAPLSVPASPSLKVGCCPFKPTFRSMPRTPQEIYFESRGKCCKKLLQFNGYPNKVQNL